MRSRIVWGAAALLALGVSGCGREEAPPEEIVRPIKVLEISDGGVRQTREYAGEIRAAQHADMAFEVPGRITEFLVKEGEDVEKGQQLAKLDPRDYQAALDSDLARLRQARSELQRARHLFEHGVGPQVDVERQERNVKVLEAQLVQSRKAVEDTVLVAPFDGKMARKLVEDFQNVKAKEPVLIVQDDSKLKLKVNVPERDIARSRSERPDVAQLNARIRPRVVVSSLPDREFPAQLVELATTADPSTRTFEATFLFDRPTKENVLPGMTAKVRVDVSPEGAARGIEIPASALLGDAEGHAYVWVVDPRTQAVSKRPVEAGELTGDQVVIESGLAAGDRVAVSGVTHLREGMRVSVLER